MLVENKHIYNRYCRYCKYDKNKEADTTCSILNKMFEEKKINEIEEIEGIVCKNFKKDVK